MRRSGRCVCGASRMYFNDPLPGPSDFDLLIVMGGPMSANDDWKHRYLAGEKRLIERSIRSGKAVLGVCLGAQLIASALGARVFKNRYREIGWFTVEVTEEGRDSPFFGSMPSRPEVFMWHEETFDLSDGARKTVRGGACENQAFVCGRNIVGLQFHLELTREQVRGMIRDNPSAIGCGKYVQSPAALVGRPRMFAAANRMMDGVLSGITESIDCR